MPESTYSSLSLQILLESISSLLSWLPEPYSVSHIISLELLGKCWRGGRRKGGEGREDWVLSNSATPQTVVHQVPLSLGFSRQEYWSELPFPPPGDLPDPGFEPRSPTLQVNSLLSKPSGKPLNYWDSLLHNFSVADFVIFRFIPHSWLPFPFLKPFSSSPPSPQDDIIVLKASIVTFPMTASSTPSLPFPCCLAEATYTPTAYSCPYAVLFFPQKLLLMLFLKFILRNCSLLKNLLPSSPPIHQPN